MYALYQCKNLTRAAAQLYLSQPALTKRLQRIEAELGIQIALRGSKGISLTPQGEYLARRAKLLVDAFEETKRHLNDMSDGSVGTLRIGAPNSVARFTLPALLKAYGETQPGVQFQVSVDLSAQVQKKVQARQLHVGFVRGDRAHGLDSMLFSSDRAWIISSRELTIADLPERPMIVHHRDTFSQQQISRWWKEIFRQPPRANIMVDDVDTARVMVSQGLGYAVFFDDYLEGTEQLYRFPIFDANGEQLRRNTWLLYRRDASAVPLLARFLEFAAAYRPLGKSDY